MATMRLNPPDLVKAGNYERYKQELLAWRQVTVAKMTEQGVAVALSLSYDHPLCAHVIFLADDRNCCVLSWHSGKIKRVVRSTLAAEALSLQEGLDEGVYLRGVLAGVIGIKLHMEAYVDNRSVVDAIHSTKMVDDKRLRIDLAAIRQLLDNGEVLKVCWCPGEYQLANCLTKRGASANQLMTVLSSGKLSGFQ